MAFCFLLVLLMKENKEIRNRGQKRGMTVTEIIYLDIDGTLRDERYGIPDSAKKAIQKCMDDGIFVVICTGRNPGSIQDDVKRLQTDGVISGGGCFIEFRGEVLKREYFPMRILGEFLEVIRKRKLGASLEAEDEIYMNEAAAKFYREDFRRARTGNGFRRKTGFPMRITFLICGRHVERYTRSACWEKKKRSTRSGNRDRRPQRKPETDRVR